MLFPQRAFGSALVAVALLGVPAQALAAPTYPPGGNSITVSSTSPPVGSPVSVSAKTYEPGSEVDVAIALVGESSGAATVGLGRSGGGSGRLGAALPPAAASSCEEGSTCVVVADSAGLATASVTFSTPGSHAITFEGTGIDGEPLTQTVEITVAAAAVADLPQAQAPNSDLATTGPQDLVQTLAIAFVMLGIGTALVLVVRRRRDSLNVA